MHERDRNIGPRWGESWRLVGANFVQIFDAVDETNRELDEHKDDTRTRFEAVDRQLTTLNTKSAIVGFLGGAIAAALVGLAVNKFFDTRSDAARELERRLQVLEATK